MILSMFMFTKSEDILSTPLGQKVRKPPWLGAQTNCCETKLTGLQQILPRIHAEEGAERKELGCLYRW